VLGVLLQWDYDPAGGGLWGRFTIPFSKWFFSPAYCLLAAAAINRTHFMARETQVDYSR
jgi:hypothetical protein